MFIGQRSSAPARVDVAVGTAFPLLVELAAASRKPPEELPEDLADALAAIGDTEGETWLNLLGIPLDAGRPYEIDRLLAELRSLDAVELRRHLLGRFAWSWCTLAGPDDIESAAAGDPSAATRLLAHPRYYGGHARTSLGVLVHLDPEETRRRIVRAVEAASDLLGKAELDALAQAGAAAAGAIADLPELAAIERLTNGYRYVPEPEAERVVLIPHLEPGLPLVLAQHRASRLIVYRATPDRRDEERLLALGRALADPKRVEILALVGRGVATAQELVGATGLSRSTVHHHLAQLRDAGLVALEGNARAYAYVPRPAAPSEAARLVADVLGTKEEL